MRSLALLLAIACACDYPDKVGAHGELAGAAPDTVTPQSVTWHGAVRALFQTRCVRCHVADGPAPMALDDYATAAGYRDLIGSKVERGEMPPWPVDPSCRPLTVSHALTSDERAMIAAWLDGGTLEGNPADYVAPPEPQAFSPSSAVEVALSGVAYQPEAAAAAPRCFLMTPASAPDAPNLDGWWVTDFRIEPDATRIVRQATLYLVADPSVAIAGGAGGYACPAGAGSDAAAAVAAWVPGAPPTSFPQQTALFVPPGARFVLRLRYDTTRFSGPIPTDASRATLWHYEGSRPPDQQVRVHTLNATGAGAEPAELPYSGSVFATIAEMGPLGSLLHAEYGTGPSPTCLARVLEWDEWQETLYYAEPLPTQLGDRQTQLLCQHAAASSDPTCHLHLFALMPLYASPHAPDSACNGVDTCLQICRGPYCLLDCLAWASPACGACAPSQLLGECLGGLDATTRSRIDACLADCPAVDDMASWTQCALRACGADLPIILETLRGEVERGACNRPDESCLYYPPGTPP